MVLASLTASEATADENPQTSVTVIVSAYNESATIAEEVRRTRAGVSDSANLQLLPINDGLADGTGERRRLQDLFRRVQ